MARQGLYYTTMSEPEALSAPWGPATGDSNLHPAPIPTVSESPKAARDSGGLAGAAVPKLSVAVAPGLGASHLGVPLSPT